MRIPTDGRGPRPTVGQIDDVPVARVATPKPAGATAADDVPAGVARYLGMSAGGRTAGTVPDGLRTASVAELSDTSDRVSLLRRRSATTFARPTSTRMPVPLCSPWPVR